MNYLYYNLGYLEKGKIVEVRLSSQANVKLMSASNYNNYKAGRRHSFYGGRATVSPTRITVPSNGNWYLTVDLGGYSGTIKASVNVLPGLLVPIKTISNSPMPDSLFLGEINGAGISTRKYDVFISHASEDKDEVARPLAESLRKKRVNGLV